MVCDGFQFHLRLASPTMQWVIPHRSEVFSPWLWSPGKECRVRNPHAGGVEKGGNDGEEEMGYAGSFHCLVSSYPD